MFNSLPPGCLRISAIIRTRRGSGTTRSVVPLASFRWGLSPSDGNRNQHAIAPRSPSRRGFYPRRMMIRWQRARIGNHTHRIASECATRYRIIAPRPLSPNRPQSGSVRCGAVFLGFDYFGIGWAAHSGTELNLGSELPPPNQFPKNPPSDRPLLARSFGGA